MKTLEVTLRSLRERGRTALVAYFVAGATPDWTRHVQAAVHGGADVIEIGVPFSDPMMDGVVIQEGALRALERGTTLDSICQELESLDATVPFVAMTYYNIILHYGLQRSTGRLRAAGVSGAIVPDLTLEESGEWRAACDEQDVASVFLVAPSTPTTRVRDVAQCSQGFVYASARMAVTGVARSDGEGARVVGELREVCDLPLYVGIGISTPAHAKHAASYSDGVIVGSALVKVILEGGSPSDVETVIRSFRDAIDR